MAFTEYTKDTTIVGALGTNPAERALTTQEFKDKFDQFAEEFVTWFNATHLAEAAEKEVVDAHLADTVPHAELVSRTITVGTGKDFSKIQDAIDSIKKHLKATITINVDADLYNEDIVIAGFYGSGGLEIIGSISLADTHVVNSFAIKNCFYVYIKGFKIATTIKHSIVVESTLNLNLHLIKADSNTGTSAGVMLYNTIATIDSCLIANKHTALYANFLSTISSNNWDANSVGNIYGIISSNASTVGKSGTQPAGTTAEFVTSGGVIR